MIVKDISDIKKHIGINKGFDFDEIEPYNKRAVRKFLKPYIGAAQLAIFVAAATDADIVEAKELAAAAEANFAYYLYLPIASVQIATSGIYVAENDHAKAASDKNLKELQRSFKSAGHEALDQLLEFMETKKSKFEPWTADASYTNYKSLLVNSTSIFNKYFNIFNGYQTFFALVPTIRTVENQFISGPIGATLLKALKDAQTDEKRIQVKEYLQQSIVCFCIAKTVHDGLFVLGAEGLFVRFDVLPYEKVNTNINLKINYFLTHTQKSKTIEGEQYLKAALKIITENTGDFAEYEAPTTASTHVTFTKTLGIVGI